MQLPGDGDFCPASVPQIWCSGFESGRIAAEPFVGELSKLLGLKTTYGEFCDLWTSVFFEDTLVPESLIAGSVAGIACWSFPTRTRFISRCCKARYPVFKHFDDFVLSYQVGALKPDAEIYREAIQRAGCRARGMLFHR